MLEGFDFATPSIANRLTGKLSALRYHGKLSALRYYNALRVPADFFADAMGRLRERFLNVPLDSVLHPASARARQAVEIQQAAAGAAPAVGQEKGEKKILDPKKFEKFMSIVQHNDGSATIEEKYRHPEAPGREFSKAEMFGEVARANVHRMKMQ